MNTKYQNTTVSDFLDIFAGRREMENYDEKKALKIAECNRDFVWTLDMQKELICSILQGFPIPTIYIVNGQIIDGGNRSTTLWRFRNGAFKVKPFPDCEDMDYEKMCTDRTLTRRWDSAVIPQQVIDNASPDQVAQIYENLNKGVKLTFGQLLENRKHRPWVAMAEALIGRGNGYYPDIELLHRVGQINVNKTKNRGELGFAFQILAGAALGPQHFHLSFVQHSPLIMGETIPTTGNLNNILDMIDSCDPERTVSAKKKKDIFKKFIGAIINDMYIMQEDEWRDKWTTFILQAYNNLSDKKIKKIINVGNLRGNSSSRIEGVSENVRRFLQDNGIEGDSDDDSISDEEDNESV